MILYISSYKKISDIQEDFNAAYPFLKIEFYQTAGKPGSAVRQKLNKTSSLAIAGLWAAGELEIYDTMTVGQLEKTFRDKFGITVQVSRKSGTLWLETTMTDNWTLKQQNGHGKELSEPLQKNNVIDEDRYEGDDH